MLRVSMLSGSLYKVGSQGRLHWPIYVSAEYILVTPSIDTQSTCLYQHIGGLFVDMLTKSWLICQLTLVSSVSVNISFYMSLDRHATVMWGDVLLWIVKWMTCVLHAWFFREMIGKPMFFMLSVLLSMHILSSFAGCHKNPWFKSSCCLQSVCRLLCWCHNHHRMSPHM